jgi:hypothetical protein
VKEFWTRYGWWLLLLCVAFAALIVCRFSPERVNVLARDCDDLARIQHCSSPAHVHAIAPRSQDGPDRWQSRDDGSYLENGVPGHQEQSSDGILTITVMYCKDGIVSGVASQSDMWCDWEFRILNALANRPGRRRSQADLDAELGRLALLRNSTEVLNRLNAARPVRR